MNKPDCYARGKVCPYPQMCLAFVCVHKPVRPEHPSIIARLKAWAKRHLGH